MKASNNLPFIFYDEAEIQKQEASFNSVRGLEIITFVILFLSLIPAKIIGLELTGVLQLAYFSLIQEKNINALLEPFMTMKEINGFNPNFLDESQQSLPDQVSSLGISSLFLNNCSLMLLLIILELIVAGILFSLSHIIGSMSKKMALAFQHLIKEGLLTLMMFNSFNIAFGTGIHFKYADAENNLYGLSSLAAILSSFLVFVPCVMLIAAKQKGFGEFKQKLKPDLMCQLYFVFSLIYRYFLGFYIAVKAEYSLSTLIAVGFSLLFLSYNFVNLPFRQAYQNYRANLCHLSQFTILIVANFHDGML